MSGKRRRQDFCGKGEPLTVFTRVSEKGQEESRGASVTDAAGMDVPEDPEMRAGNWERPRVESLDWCWFCFC